METLSSISKEVVKCRACPRLVDWREEVAEKKRAAFSDQNYWGKAVPGFGDPKARIVVMGLAPAAHGANRTGRMFTGDRSGDWLYRALFKAGLANQPNSTHLKDGLKLNGAYITSPVKCAPPANKPAGEEQDACRHFLMRELACLKSARVFVALGQIAYTAVAKELALQTRPAFSHGLEVSLKKGRFLICSYHTSQQNTFTKRLTEKMLDQVMARAKALAGLA